MVSLLKEFYQVAQIFTRLIQFHTTLAESSLKHIMKPQIQPIVFWALHILHMSRIAFHCSPLVNRIKGFRLGYSDLPNHIRAPNWVIFRMADQSNLILHNNTTLQIWEITNFAQATSLSFLPLPYEEVQFTGKVWNQCTNYMILMRFQLG